ncbi:MAG: Xanthine phosphoribosyltransferase [Chlamydiae bacterium]|nr:Xanthine phosphoribosyltransferase [Chlamydiota bacterium]
MYRPAIATFLIFISLTTHDPLSGSEMPGASMIQPSWDEVHDIVGEICQKIDPNQIDVLFGVSVGGLVPTALFSVELENKNVATISARSYVGREQKSLKVAYGPEKGSIRGKNVLLIDDIVDTGATIRMIKKLLLTEYGAKAVKVASLYVKENSPEYPDFWGEEINDWVEFPWECRKSS